ncbi:unnamed protein product [Dibothriocephalus latus]|uniref:Uncharacterized protein n=1 Tax=Dibothriocephalus latus TaxID=60516 RepID=A0A3P6R5X8_DIBLA|nr:unnamed protein product [Dibothriocephalus latus]
MKSGSGDAVRRTILVVPEGVESGTNVGRELCIPEMESDTSPFSISVHTIQAQDDTIECTQPKTTICVRLSEHAVNTRDPLSEDTILLTFESPTGWKQNCADLAHLSYPGLSHAECDAKKQKLFVHYDPFTEVEAEYFDGRDKLVRCISRTLIQTTFVEPLIPSVIRVQYENAPQEKTEVHFKLNTCKRYWESRVGL